MSVSISQIQSLKETLLRKYDLRNQAYSKLREYYNAEYWKGTEVQGIKLIYNLLAAAVDRYTDYMIQPPDWRVIPAGTTKAALDMADKQEKLLYMQYDLNDIAIVQGWLAHLQSMLGFPCLEIRPNPGSKEKLVTLDVPVPEFVLPMPKSDNIWDMESVIILSDSYSANSEQFKPDIRHDQRISQTNVIKYYDKNELVVVENGKETNRIVHNFGFIPVVFSQNKVKPHYVEGVGDLEQAAGLQKYFNDLLSWQADIIEYSANPIQLLFGYTGDKLPNGPGVQWQLGQGMDARFLTWPGQPPDVERMMGRIQQAIEDLTITTNSFGREVPSGTSGSAVKSLMSGLQASFVRKQLMMGVLYKKANEIIFRIIEKYFKEKEIVLRGTKKGDIFYETMKGGDIAGNYRTQIIWPPGILDQAGRTDLELAKMNAGVQSRRTTMENIGTISPKDELDLISNEKEEDMAHEMMKSNPSAMLGISPKASKEYQGVSEGLQAQDFGGQSDIPTLIQFVASIPRIKGDVYIDTAGGKTTLVLTDNRDKATILNRLPARFKGKDKLFFRPYNEASDEGLQVIVESPEDAVAPR